MSVTRVSALLQALPPFQWHRDVIVRGNQSLGSIIREVKEAHERYSADYDKIAQRFAKGDVLKRLFEFTKSLPYVIESKHDQTTRSPAGILETASISGVDCKHYAGFIAGVLDALNRKGSGFNWKYRFASYNRAKPDLDHVFVVVDEVWLDPTPVQYGDELFERSFNDRIHLPVKYIDKKVNTMLSTLSGVKYIVGDDSQVSNACLGNVRPGQVGITIPGLGVSDATIRNVAGKVADLLPPGGFKDFLKSWIDNPVQSFLKLFGGGFTYPEGWHVLGEWYMRNILGMTEIQTRRQVPDAYVPQAMQFFTVALGVRIHSSDHLEKLAESAGAYKSWVAQFNLTAGVPDASIERASQICRALGLRDVMAIRNMPWPLATFGSIPYQYPIPDADINTFFTGVHPITEIELINGYPKAAGPGNGQGPGPGIPGQPPPKPKGKNDWLTYLVIAGVAYAGYRAIKK